MKKSLILILTTLLIFSCSIQKRQHLPGYHVTFHKNYKKNSKEIDQKQVVLTEENELAIEQTIQKEEAISKLNLSDVDAGYSEDKELKEDTKPIIKAEREKYVITYNLNSRKSKLVKIQKAKNISKKDLDIDNQQFSVFALLGFIFAILGLLLLLTTGFPFLMAATAIVLSSIALHRFRTGKDVARGKGLAIAGLIIGILSMLVFWVIVIVVILFLTSGFYW